MTATLLLRLAGPMQSWGDRSRFTRRETRQEPTKSGVLGLLAAAQGRRRTDPIEDLAGLRFGVRVDQPGRVERDFQTAIRWAQGSGKDVSMPLSERFYLADAAFLAGVEGDRELLAGLDESLRSPVFGLFLGRRAYPVEGRVSLGVRQAALEDALREEPWLASTWYRKEQGRVVHLPLSLDGEAGPSTGRPERVRDVPISYSSERREYGWRLVNVAAPVVVDNPAGHDHMDFFAALGGA